MAALNARDRGSAKRRRVERAQVPETAGQAQSSGSPVADGRRAAGSREEARRGVNENRSVRREVGRCARHGDNDDAREFSDTQRSGSGGATLTGCSPPAARGNIFSDQWTHNALSTFLFGRVYASCTGRVRQVGLLVAARQVLLCSTNTTHSFGTNPTPAWLHTKGEKRYYHHS